jgi:hypothetical protein
MSETAILRQQLTRRFPSMSPRSPPRDQLWNDHQSAALLIALPSVLNICERNTFRLYAKLPAGSNRTYLKAGSKSPQDHRDHIKAAISNRVTFEEANASSWSEQFCAAMQKQLCECS